jgi:hypothetical protein
LVVARNAVEGGDTVSNAFVEGSRTGEYVMHTWYCTWMVRSGKAGVGDVIFGAVLKEGVFYLQFVRSKNLEEIFTARIASWDAVRSKCFLVFVAVSYTNPRIDVSLKFICMRRPTKSSLVVIGGGDPAAFHAS